MRVWVLECENVEGRDWIELYSTREKAYKAFDMYANKYGDMEEFEKFRYGILWFDPNYDECCSYIYIYQQEVIE